MLTFLVLCAAGFAALIGIVVIPLLLIGMLVWLVTLPFRLFFGLMGLVFGLVFGTMRFVFGFIGALLGLLFAPVLLGVLGIVVVGALIVGLISLLAPLIPVALLGLLAWAVYRLVSHRPSPTF